MTELKNSPDSQGTENGDGNASTSGLRVAPAYLLGLSAIVGVCLSQTTTIFLPALDRELALRLEILFHILPAQVSGQPDIAHSQIDVAFGPLGIASISSMFFVLVVAVVSTLIGKLSVVPRLIGWLQLFVLSLLMHWFFFTARLQVHPVAAFSAIVYGGIIGYGWRLFNTYEKKKLSKYFEMMLRNKELQEARLQMVRQDEVDRRLLAGDLHDQVLNDLKILNQRFQSYRHEPTDENASQIDRLLHQAMNGVRDVMDSLSPTVLEHLGFYAAVEDCLRRAGERGGFKVRCKKEGPVDQLARLDLIEQTLLFRLVQECGNNITKHAQASMVKLRLEVTDKVLVLSISDNGVGIPEAVDVNESRGLKYMRQRGDLIGATIAWLAAEGGQGTTVEIRMPLKNRK